MKLLQEILNKSRVVNKKFEDLKEKDTDSVTITFKVPKFHPRALKLDKYPFSPLKLEDLVYEKEDSVF
ncbi:MAG: hypothetical protein ABIH92_02700, partial [Nanoarchaeota archaeon]